MFKTYKVFIRCCLIIVCLFSSPVFAQQNLYEVEKGLVSFHSDAPQELIRASSNQLKGIIDVKNKVFVFKVSIGSFVGFNNPLQREHFNENYMETIRYPEAVFNGKIIEDVELTKEGQYTVRAKGKFLIHGITQERIIKSTVTVKKNRLDVKSAFIISLSDYNIKIPRVVSDKLAPDINVVIEATLMPKK